MLEVSLGIDIEPDCPPYLATQYRGVEHGLPKILDLLDEMDVRVTCFCTGGVAERYPGAVENLVAGGHELGCHGHTHSRFDRMSDADAEREVALSTSVLRQFGTPVTSFRAPNLQMPHRYYPLLEEHGYTRDSSQAKYKVHYYRAQPRTKLIRIPASMTSSVLRLPSRVRDPWLSALSSPVVLFMHPWEFVDLTRERLRLDCRFRTGNPALLAVRDVIALFRDRGAVFRRLDQVLGPARQVA
jgi:peptidoglycan-N-acetylglucosamine deacetylase